MISNIDINAVLRHSLSSIKFYLWIGIFKRANKILYLKKVLIKYFQEKNKILQEYYLEEINGLSSF